MRIDSPCPTRKNSIKVENTLWVEMHPIIRKSLGISQEAWPPDYYTLLGLELGACMADVETAVLSRMERLRAYQLAHPEPVTETMNLLARALVVLSDPKSRAAYDRTLAGPIDDDAHEEPIAPIVANVVQQTFPEAVPPFGTHPPSTIHHPPSTIHHPKPPPLPNEPARYTIEERRVVPPPLPVSDVAWLSPDDPDYLNLVPLPSHQRESSDRIVRAPTADERRRPSEWLASRSSSQSSAAVLSRGQKERKRAQARWLVRMRRLLRAWDDAGSFLAIPRAAFADRAHGVAVIQALRRIATDGGHVITDRGAGSLVLETALDRATLVGLAELTAIQRNELADDWRAGRAVILDSYWSARRSVGRRNRKSRFRRFIRRWKRYSPELALAALALFGLTIALVR